MNFWVGWIPTDLSNPAIAIFKVIGYKHIHEDKIPTNGPSRNECGLCASNKKTEEIK